MAERKAANVILAKVHAMHGRRLFPNDYQNMVSRVDIPQLASYIKNETYYGEYLTKYSENELTYTILEQVIYDSMFERIEKLLKYDFADNQDYFDYMILRGEMTVILGSLRSIVAEAHDVNKVATVPRYLDLKSPLDLVAVQAAKTFKELLETLRGSKYYALIMGSYGGDEEHIQTEKVEFTLMTDYLNTIFLMVKNFFSGNTRKQLEEIFRLHVDVTNVPLIFRLRRYFKYEKEEVLANLLPFDGNISQKELHTLIDFPTDNPKGFLERCVQVLLGSHFDAGSITNVEQAAHRVSYDYYNHVLHYSLYPACVYTAYVELMAIEVKNVINIVEGIRYRVSPQEIEELVIY